MPTREIYLVGSVPLGSSAEVFETASAYFGTNINQIPDGEVGERGDWISHLQPIFSENPAFEPSDEVFSVHSGSAKRVRYRLKPGVKASDVRFEKLGYADVAIASYETFRRLKDEGKIDPGTRFQIDLVPAHSVIWLFVVEREQALIDPVYNAAVRREMEVICSRLPHDDISIQFDVASAVFARLERGEPTTYGSTKSEMVDTFSEIVAQLANPLPPEIPLLFHFCYGDANHKHAIEPTDMGDMVDMANALAEKIKRPIDLIHMPVPRERDDDAYFAPLQRLRIPQKTKIILGLVHYTDGAEGTRRRIETAQKHLSDFGVATECGFGRRDPATLPKLFELHVAAASA